MAETIAAIVAAHRAGTATPEQTAARSFARIRAYGDPAIFISLRPEGDVQGDTHVQLTFPVGEVNDLLKSLVLQDQDKGKVGVITYDSHDPVDKTLRSFAVNMNGNPTYGQILNQARGEKVEVVYRPRKDAPTEKLTGTLVGMQS